MTPTLERARRAGACFGHATLALLAEPARAFDADCELFEKAKEQAL